MSSRGIPNKLPRIWVYLILLLGLAVSSLLGFAAWQNATPIRQLDRMFFDTLSKRSASGSKAQSTLVVDIDEASLSAAGQWPWPRYRMAALVQAIAKAKPAAIGLDILFPEVDRTSLSNIRQSFRQDFGLDLVISGAPAELSDNDGYFGQVLAQTGVVGAKYFYFDHTNKTEVPAAPEFRISGRTDLLALREATGVLANTYKIAAQLKYSGYLNYQPDGDGMLRSLPLLISYHGAIYPHLALATFMRAMGVSSAEITEDKYGPLIRVGSHAIPVDRHGYALLRYNGKPQLYPAVSAVDVLNGTVGADEIKGKTIFVGSSAIGLSDLHSTIFDSQFPGLKTQAAMVENMVSNNFVREPIWSKTAILLGSIVIGLLIAVLFVLVREPLPLFLGTSAVAGAVLLLCTFLFLSLGIVASPAAPVLVTAILFTLFTVTRFVLEKRNAYLWFKKLANAQQVTIESMSAVAETRDNETGAHIKRVQYYTKAIAERLRDTGQYADILTQDYIDMLFISAPLHDIGKVGVPDNILLKPGKHTEAEFELMKKHAEFGRDMICSTAKKIEGDNYLKIAGEVAATHHEKWDGTGYPHGLAGLDIPLSGRIVVVADVYDALISRRCYKPPFPHETAMENMRLGRAKSFDPVVLDAFFSIEEQIKEIAASYRDDQELVLGDR